jgi:hypothetical protein
VKKPAENSTLGFDTFIAIECAAVYMRGMCDAHVCAAAADDFDQDSILKTPTGSCYVLRKAPSTSTIKMTASTRRVCVSTLRAFPGAPGSGKSGPEASVNLS